MEEKKENKNDKPTLTRKQKFNELRAMLESDLEPILSTAELREYENRLKELSSDNLDYIASKIIDELDEQIETETDLKLISNKATRIIAYSENFNIVETEIANALTSQSFSADLKVFSKSEEKINKLKHQDREILDYIVLTLYPNNINPFSDYQIATGLYKKKTRETISDTMLKEINESINRLRDIRIDEGFISEEKIKDVNTKVKINDHLINLRQLEYESDKKTTYYLIIGAPFYYDYAVNTGKIRQYSKELITRDIEDKKMEHNIKNDTLKMFLARRVKSLEWLKKQDINMKEIYDILGINDNRKYTEVRKKVKAILDDFKDDSQETYYNFKYSFKKKNRTITALLIERVTDKPLEITKK